MKMAKPLAGLRVIDLTQAASGPMCAAHFAAFGAEVLKIEVPGVGDSARRAGPYGGKNGVSRVETDPSDVATYYLKRNRDKKGLNLNLKSPKGLAILYRMVEKSDIVLDNYRPGVTARLKVDFDNLKKIKPDIICCSITGFGHTGPYRSRAAYDTVVQAMSGAMEVTGFPGGRPTRAGFLAGDGTAPLFATAAVLAALRHRDQTGEGQAIDVSMLDCLASLVWDLPIDFMASGGRPVRVGNQMGHVPGNVYPCSDGEVVIIAGQQHQWKKMAALIGREDMLADPRFFNLDDRIAHSTLVDRAVQDWTEVRARAEVIAACEAAGLACGPIQTMHDLLDDPHLKARGLVGPLPHPEHGVVPGATATGYPVSFGTLDVGFHGSAPMQGQHTREVLSSLLGMSAAELDELQNEKVI